MTTCMANGAANRCSGVHDRKIAGQFNSRVPLEVDINRLKKS
jgi:hypothetical protein